MMYLDKDNTWVRRDLVSSAVGDPLVDGKDGSHTSTPITNFHRLADEQPGTLKNLNGTAVKVQTLNPFNDLFTWFPNSH
jgi:hypothetical protein